MSPVDYNYGSGGKIQMVEKKNLKKFLSNEERKLRRIKKERNITFMEKHTIYKS